MDKKLHFNETKSKDLLVSTKRLDNRTLNIYFNNKRVEKVTELKYLGIYFDSRFCFDRHVEYITGKCTPIINTGGFISPSGISELDCATTKTDTAERSISIGRESLQVFLY